MSTLPLFDRRAGGDGEDEAGEPRPWRVAEVNRAVRMSLEEAFGEIWVEGELSDVSRSGGHVYFTLSDEDDPAQLSGVMFRTDAVRARARLVKGARVRVRGTLSVWETRGRFQIIARIALPAGAGELRAQLRKLYVKLKAEGLFDEARKRPLPRWPRVVGVVTSASGAALQDVLRVTQQRCPVRVVVADCRVQGEGAADSVLAALAAVQRLPELDVVIVTRGGGSAEDLFAFQDERLARAIVECRVPVVAGIGHETDVTMAELAADVRAATPSNAAERAVPDREALRTELDALLHKVEKGMARRLDGERLRIERARALLPAPGRDLARARARIDELHGAAASAQRRRLAAGRAHLIALGTRLNRHDGRTGLARDRKVLMALDGRLRTWVAPTLAVRRRSLQDMTRALRCVEDGIGDRAARLSELAARLDAMSPVKVLARGYAIALHDRTGRALLRANEARPGDSLTIRLSEGSLNAEVKP